MDILEELWNGNLCPVSQEHYRAKDYRDLVHLYERVEGSFLPTMNEGQKVDFGKLLDLQEEMRNISECNAFCTGF